MPCTASLDRVDSQEFNGAVRMRVDVEDHEALRAYSDDLLARGDSRGTLIRLEQRLARTGPTERSALRQQIDELVAQDEAGWDDGLPGAATVLSRQYGFATGVALDWSDDLGEVAGQVLESPFVSTLRIVATGPLAADDGDEEWSEEDDAWGTARPGTLDLRPLAELDLGRLVELDLGYLDVGVDGAEALAGAFRTDRLRVLDLRYCGIGDEGVTALAAVPALERLRRLHLQRDALGPAGVRALHGFPALTELDLRYNPIGVGGTAALLAAPFVGSLEKLWLYDSDVGEQGARALADAAELPVALRNVWRCR
jgi:hypothetical protein